MQYAFGPQIPYTKAEPTAKVQFLHISCRVAFRK